MKIWPRVVREADVVGGRMEGFGSICEAGIWIRRRAPRTRDARMGRRAVEIRIFLDFEDGNVEGCSSRRQASPKPIGDSGTR